MLLNFVAPLTLLIVFLLQFFDGLLSLSILLLLEVFLFFLHLFQTSLDATLPRLEHLPTSLLRLQKTSYFRPFFVHLNCGWFWAAAWGESL